MKHLLIVIALGVFLLSVLTINDAEARRSGGGFGKSSFSRSTFGFGGKKVGRVGAWSGGNMSKRVGTKGNVFASKGKAEAAYRKNLKTKWNTEPSVRPGYVPRTYSDGGKSYNVGFQNGGYGYWGPSNTWVALAAGSMLMNSTILANQGYYYGTRRHRGGFTLFPILLLVFFAVAFSGKFAERLR